MPRLYATQKAVQEPPSKFVTSVAEVQLACRLLFVDMEGLNDGRAVKTIVPKVDPRKLVLDGHDFLLPMLTLRRSWFMLLLKIPMSSSKAALASGP